MPPHTFKPLVALLIGCIGVISGCGGNAGSGGAPSTRVPINTATGWSDSPFISRDGQRLYFTYSRYNFGPWILSGGTVMPQATGPDRPGLRKSAVNPFDESDIYMATRNPDGTWSEPVNLGFNGPGGDASGMEIDGGNTFVWLHGLADGSTSRIVVSTKNPDGSWSAPVDPGNGINTTSGGTLQDNPHLSPDGNAMWFTSTRPGGLGGKDLWFSYRTAGVWSAPVNTGTPFSSSAGDDDQFWLSPTSSNDVYWNGQTGLMHCVSNGSTCAAAPTVVTIPGCAYVAEVSMPDDGQRMYFGCGSFTTGRVSIMYSVKQPNGSWGTATPVD
ncbi:MAG: hypothetical protein ABW190_17360 [Rhizobacter sp.]